jgi:hypothetical protein
LADAFSFKGDFKPLNLSTSLLPPSKDDPTAAEENSIERIGSGTEDGDHHAQDQCSGAEYGSLRWEEGEKSSPAQRSSHPSHRRNDPNREPDTNDVDKQNDKQRFIAQDSALCVEQKKNSYRDPEK